MFFLPGDVGTLIFLCVIAGIYILSYLYERYLTSLRDNEQYPQTAIAGSAATTPQPPAQRRLADKDEIVFETYVKESSKEDGGGGCAICLDEYKDGETRAAIAACNHRFHAACIKEWLGRNPNCPLCRTHVV